MNRRALIAEAIGTLGLLTIVVGSGIMGERLAGGNIAIALLANALATGLGLFVLIAVFAPISGAHFNPIVSLVRFADRALDGRTCMAYVLVQAVAAVAGVLLAHAMFGQSIFQIGDHQRTGVAQWISEFVATAGLILTICAAEERGTVTAAAMVACYITAAYWFTASTAFANPAVTVARSLTASFAGIAPNDVVAFIGAQIAGGIVAYFFSRYLFTANRKDVEIAHDRT